MATRRTSNSKSSSKKTSSKKTTAKRTTKAAPRREARSPFRPILPLAVTLIIGLGMVLVYVSLDAQIEMQAKKVGQVEEEINVAHNEYSAQLNDWQHTLQPSNLIRLMQTREVDMHFPEPRERIVLSNHDVWVRRQTAKASVNYEALPQVPGPENLPEPMQAQSFEVVPAVSRYINTDDGAGEGNLPAPPGWARPFLNVTAR